MSIPEDAKIETAVLDESALENVAGGEAPKEEYRVSDREKENHSSRTP